MFPSRLPNDFYDDPSLPAEWFWRQPTFIPFSEDGGMLGGSSDLVSS